MELINPLRVIEGVDEFLGRRGSTLLLCMYYNVGVGGTQGIQQHIA